MKHRLLARILEEAGERGIRYLTARVDAADLSTVHVLERSGFDMIDAIQTFSLHLEKKGVSGQFETRLFREPDLPQVLEIARSSYVHDRFHADSAIQPSVADRINEA